LINDYGLRTTDYRLPTKSPLAQNFIHYTKSLLPAKITIIQGDITRFNVDAIVNAANTSLLGGGGVDGAIHRAGGPAILEECKQIRAKQGGCQTGEAVITSAGNMPSKFVIHTVGPIWSGGKRNEEQLLANAYTNSLKLAKENNIKTIAIPNISTGVYGFPKDRAAEIALTVVMEYISHYSELDELIFCCFDDENFSIYSKLYSTINKQSTH
jgi:O-acetyl-ADP-ribose deacetylase